MHRRPFLHTTQHLVLTAANPRLNDVPHYRMLATGRKAMAGMGGVQQPVQSKFYAWPMAREAFVNGRESPYGVAEG